MRRDSTRRFLFYGGIVLSVIGFFLFASVFNLLLTAGLPAASPDMGNSGWFEEQIARQEEWWAATAALAVRGLLGMGLMVAGMMLTKMGNKGLTEAALGPQPKPVEPQRETAFELGRSQIHLENIPEEQTPQLLATKVDPAQIVFTSPKG